MTRPLTSPPSRAWVYFLSFAILVLLGAAVQGIYSDSSQNRAAQAAATARDVENKARDAQQADLLKCIDGVLSDFTQSSAAVRVASAARDDATAARDTALKKAFAFIASDPAPDDPRGVRLIGDLLIAQDNLVQASKRLTNVRAENPVPEESTITCGTANPPPPPG